MIPDLVLLLAKSDVIVDDNAFSHSQTLFLSTEHGNYVRKEKLIATAMAIPRKLIVSHFLNLKITIASRRVVYYSSLLLLYTNI